MELSSATEGVGEEQNEEQWVGGWIMGHKSKQEDGHTGAE